MESEKKRSTMQELVLREEKGYYFESYSELDAHENMIKDYNRTMAYRRAIEMNPHLFQDKVVLDVGCGMGILSLFAARAGAKTVIAVDASDITVYAQKIIKANNYNNIIIKNAKIEELEDLHEGIEKVDIIISEWMGICLYHESMLASVIYARDRWLKKNGLIFPDKVCLYLAAIDDREKVSRVESWNCVAGFSMREFKDIMYGEAVATTVEPNKVVTNYSLIHELDLNRASSDFSFNVNYTLNAERDGSVVGFITYFDAIFSKCHRKIVLSTSPNAPLTHWRQTLFRFRDSMYIDRGVEITGKFMLKPFQHNFRDLFFQINVQNISSRVAHHFTCSYVLR